MKQKGYTFIELLVTAGIFAIISLIIAQVFFVVLRSNTKTGSSRNVKDTGDRIMESMIRSVQNSKEISVELADCPESPTIGTALSELTVVDVNGRETTFKCATKTVNGLTVPHIASESGAYAGFKTEKHGEFEMQVPTTFPAQLYYITGEDVVLAEGSKITCADKVLTFYCNSIHGVPAFITISFSLKHMDPSGNIVQSSATPFQSTVSLRSR